MATITNPTPRQRFQQSAKTVSAHRELMQRPDLEAGMDFALMEYQRQLAQSVTTFNDAAANHFKITGALEYIQTLRNLAEPSALPSLPKQDNLPQNR